MKMFVSFIALVMLCCTCITAMAAFDLKPYMYADNGVIPVARDTRLFLSADSAEHHIRLEQNGVVIREVSMAKNGDRLNVVLGEEGNIGLITRPDLAGGQAQQLYYSWNEDNTLSEAVKLSDRAGYLYACGNGFYGADYKANFMEVFVRNADGKEIFSRAYMPLMEEYISPMNCVRSADGTYLLAVCRENLNTNEKTIGVERIAADGTVLWQTAFSGEYSFNGCVLSCDGEGGAYLVKASAENYKIAQVYRIGTDGQLLWMKHLEAEGLILHAFCGGYDEAEGGLVIDGNVVSRAKGVYRVIRVVIDGDGCIVHAGARDFSCRPDYGFTVLRAVDGSVFVQSYANYLDTKNTKHVLVPADALPEADVPVLTLE